MLFVIANPNDSYINTLTLMTMKIVTPRNTSLRASSTAQHLEFLDCLVYQGSMSIYLQGGPEIGTFLRLTTSRNIDQYDRPPSLAQRIARISGTTPGKSKADKFSPFHPAATPLNMLWPRNIGRHSFWQLFSCWSRIIVKEIACPVCTPHSCSSR